MQDVPERYDFPGEEDRVFARWEETKAFEKSLKMTEGKPEYVFYDGPPFATGLPHYGHILAGTIKDVVTRYAHQTGHHVIRRFGWDCHGLPIEYEIDQKLGISSREDVLKMGIDKYNAECRSIVMRYSSEWETIVKRMGRWIDFKNDYKTMNPEFMESVWWVFRQLFDQGLVYRGFRVMPYSTKCNTPLSNFEANLNYKEVSDPEAVVTFPLTDDPNTCLVAWTTTPWTLPSNLGLCVNPDLDYVKVTDPDTKKTFIMMEARLVQLYKKPESVKVLEKFKGSTLVGKTYTPLFDYFLKEKEKGAFKVCSDGFVTDTGGTGIVHMAPGFGEDDYRVCQENGIISKGDDVVCPVDANGRFTPAVKEWEGTHVKEADKAIIKKLKDMGRLVKSGAIKHSYPFCWRSDTPLIYKAVPSWFVKVEEIKEKLMANNKKTYWVPDFVKEKRFHNWLHDARDWSVSRNRFWGTPIPIWASEDYEEIVCIGSVEELHKLSGVKVTDLHRDKIDDITIPSKKGKGKLRRVDEVFDCWFESGSMPYGQQHYPFENKEFFEANFPADFIAEGLDQTRGWFYTLMVISTALFDKPPFKNLIVNGLVLASDGKKMSKRLKNYPDPMDVVRSHGADALRLYLVNSPVVRAEPLRFVEGGVRDIVKDVFLPWYNAYRFFVQNARRYEQETNSTFKFDASKLAKATNVMDKWIQASCQSLIAFVKQEMEGYRLYTVTPRLLKFIENLTNWYVRCNRRRLKGQDGQKDSEFALMTLFDVLYTLCRTMAPFTPFLCEGMYLNLRHCLPKKEQQESIHHVDFPTVNEKLVNPRIEESLSRLQTVIDLGRYIRDRNKINLKTPLKELVVVQADKQYLDDIASLDGYVKDELNVRNVVLTQDEEKYVVFRAEPNAKILGKRFGKDFKNIRPKIAALSHKDLSQYRDKGEVKIDGHVLSGDDILVRLEAKEENKGKLDSQSDGAVVVLLNLEQDASLVSEGAAREVINRVQRLRKKAGLQLDDEIEVFFSSSSESLNEAIKTHAKMIETTLRVPLLESAKQPAFCSVIASEESDVNGEKITTTIIWKTFAVAPALEGLCGGDSELVSGVGAYLASLPYASTRDELKKSKSLTLTLNGKKLSLKLGQHFHLSSGDL